MTCPSIRFRPIDHEPVFTRWSRPAVAAIVRDAWEAIVGRAVPSIAAIDVVSRGPSWQMTPILTPEGTVVRLDVSAGVHAEFRRGKLQNDWELRTHVYHEIYHLADRLDPAFRLDYHFDAENAQADRKVINAVWDIYIEYRKLRRFRLAAFSCCWHEGCDSETAALENFLECVEPQDAARPVFDAVWGRMRLTYPRIRAYSKPLSLRPSGDSQRAAPAPRRHTPASAPLRSGSV